MQVYRLAKRLKNKNGTFQSIGPFNVRVTHAEDALLVKACNRIIDTIPGNLIVDEPNCPSSAHVSVCTDLDSLLTYFNLWVSENQPKTYSHLVKSLYAFYHTSELRDFQFDIYRFDLRARHVKSINGNNEGFIDPKNIQKIDKLIVIPNQFIGNPFDGLPKPLPGKLSWETINLY